MAGVVESAIYHGNLWSYRVATPAGEMLVARPPDDSDQGKGLDVGAAVVLSWDKQRSTRLRRVISGRST